MFYSFYRSQLCEQVRQEYDRYELHLDSGVITTEIYTLYSNSLGYSQKMVYLYIPLKLLFNEVFFITLDITMSKIE